MPGLFLIPEHDPAGDFPAIFLLFPLRRLDCRFTIYSFFLFSSLSLRGTPLELPRFCYLDFYLLRGLSPPWRGEVERAGLCHASFLPGLLRQLFQPLPAVFTFSRSSLLISRLSKAAFRSLKVDFPEVFSVKRVFQRKITRLLPFCLPSDCSCSLRRLPGLCNDICNVCEKRSAIRKADKDASYG